MSKHAGTTPVVELDAVSKVFGDGAAAVDALSEVALSVAAGELLVVRGRSGAGKSTLLDIIAGLQRPTSGSVAVVGRDLGALGDDELAAIRRTSIGYVMQEFGLLEPLTVTENVGLPLRLADLDPAQREARVADLVERVGLAGHAEQLPAELSGGQQQRVGIARALASDPSLLLADEPTARLDRANARRMAELLRQLVHEGGAAAIVTTHDPVVVAVADRILDLRDGRLQTPA
jgi:putative ABC transport system ATP-binding protein